MASTSAADEVGKMGPLLTRPLDDVIERWRQCFQSNHPQHGAIPPSRPEPSTPVTPRRRSTFLGASESRLRAGHIDCDARTHAAGSTPEWLKISPTAHAEASSAPGRPALMETAGP